MPVIITEKYVKFLIEQVTSLTKLVEDLTAQNAELAQTVETLNATIAQLNATIKELTEKKNKDSHNRSKPPSTDGYKKPPAPKSLWGKSDKKSGGQDGHEGSNLAQAKPGRVIGCMPSKCAHCPRHDERMAKAKVLERRQVPDAVVRIEVTDTTKCVSPTARCTAGRARAVSRKASTLPSSMAKTSSPWLFRSTRSVL